ncbi:Ni/Fe-hydrogenase cytochrome b subunit [Limisalsivibrio acetivorans]|uniref:Ni/Fe-hydrogenase cytochrome b subunit n=1 Tax=Limisalsivibrio acetivorans TaxID=1304888 RepID=UPI0003B668D9|nr:Ni/Fe-hydrogenase cytochrome b subunit [Limisalsivibrio acetivorans]
MGHHDEYIVHRSKIFTPAFFGLLAVVIIGFYYIGVRFVEGIGAVTNLSDGYPWGIWITYDVATGTAFACGGYAVAILVYIMNNMKYHPLIRSAIVTSLFGYSLAGFSVVLDLGRYWNMYGFFMPNRWQPNSVLFEVALCVMTYTLVLAIEIAPAFLERLIYSEKKRFMTIKKAARWIYPRLDKALIFFVVLGITLPTMHQSSLGSMFIIAESKMHPLWHTGLLPLLFLINCIFIGYSMVIFESTLSSVGFRRNLETREIAGLSKIIPILAAAWLGVRFYDLINRGHLADAFAGDFHSWMFLGELLLIAGGAFILSWRAYRNSPRMVFIAAIMLVIGGGWYRFNVYLIGYDPGAGWKYFPSLPEFMITLGLISFEILGYIVFVKLFPIMPKPHKVHNPGVESPVK